MQVAVACLMAFCVFYGSLYSAGFRLHGTDSGPTGVYRLVSVERELRVGDWVVFCYPDDVIRLGMERGYWKHVGSSRLPWVGLPCLGNTPYALKEVVAVEGALMRWNGGREPVLADGVQVDVYRSDTDSQGREMPAWPIGGELGRGELWVGGIYRNPRSLDSKFFGPVMSRDVVARAELVWKVGQ